MFLLSLSQEEREVFLELAVYAAKVDHELHESENALISLYRGEAQLHGYKLQGTDIETIMDFFKAKDESTRKKVFFETLGVLWIDNKVTIEECELISTLQTELKIDDVLKYKIIELMNTQMKPWFETATRLNEAGAKLLNIQ